MTMLDPAPRVVLDKELGFVLSGARRRRGYRVRHLRAHHGNYSACGTPRWLEGAASGKTSLTSSTGTWNRPDLAGGGKPPVFMGEVALVTGAASGIGKACVESLLNRGAAVVGLDIQPTIETLFKRKDYLGLRCDVTDEFQIRQALERAVRAFGGLTCWCSTPASSRPAAALTPSPRTSGIRSCASTSIPILVFMRETHPLLQARAEGRACGHHRLKECPAPGPGAAAYSASRRG